MLPKKSISRVAVVMLGAGLSVSASTLAEAADSSPAAEWTGLYAGLSAGMEFSNNTWTTTSLGLNNFAGVNPSSASPKLDSSAARIGGFVGWNFPVAPNLIAGVEADIAGISGNQNTVTGIPGVTYNFPTMGITGVTPADNVTAKPNFDGSLRVRVGTVIAPRFLAYGTAGLAFQGTDFQAYCPSGTGTSSFCGVFESQAITKTMTGWTVGAGVEAKLADEWAARLEYRYAGFGHQNLAFFGGNNLGVDSVSATVSPSSHIVAVGLEYRFGG